MGAHEKWRRPIRYYFIRELFELFFYILFVFIHDNIRIMNNHESFIIYNIRKLFFLEIHLI